MTREDRSNHRIDSMTPKGYGLPRRERTDFRSVDGNIASCCLNCMLCDGLGIWPYILLQLLESTVLKSYIFHKLWDSLARFSIGRSE